MSELAINTEVAEALEVLQKNESAENMISFIKKVTEKKERA